MSEEELTAKDVLDAAKALRDLKCEDCEEEPRQVYISFGDGTFKSVCGDCAEKYR